MQLKQKVKYMLGFVRSRWMRIQTFGKVYIGKNVNIIGKVKLGPEVSIRPYTSLWSNENGIEIGAGTEIGERCRISVTNHLKIGKKVLFSPNVYITDCDHAYEDILTPIIDQGIVKKDNYVQIKDGAYIGINVVIVGNVTIGEHCVIGANSVVTKSVPDYCVAVGCPAKVIKKYSYEHQIWESVEH